jgi:hypothetical protein
MMQYIATGYLAIFVLFFRFAKRSWSSEANAAKGAAGVTVVISALVTAAGFWIGRLAGHEHLPRISKIGFFASWFVIYLINYWLLVAKRHGTDFERQFRHFDRRRRILLLTSGWTIVAVAIGLIVLAVISQSALKN